MATTFSTPKASGKDYSKGAGGQFTQLDESTLVDENGIPILGMDKELAAKAAVKKDVALEARCKAWISAVSGSPLPEGTLQEALKDGVALCKTVNAIKAGICPKPSTGKLAFKQMENISNYQDACVKLGVPQGSLFQTVALYENKDMVAVVTNIQALGSVAQKVPGFSGPSFGVKLADTNVREFTREQLLAGAAEQTFLGKGSTGTAGAKLGAHIDRSKNIGKLDYVTGDIANMGKNGELSLMGKGSTDTEGARLGAHIDTSKNISKMDTVVGADGFGKGGGQTLLGAGSTGTAGAAMGAHIDTSKNISKMDTVVGADGFGKGNEQTMLGMGSTGTAGAADAFQVDTSKNISKMDTVAGAVAVY